MMSSKAGHSCILPSNECGHTFCSTALAPLMASVSSTAIYGRKTKLFVEGQEPRGVFIIRTGEAKLTICSALGKTITVRLADAGDVLGLSAVVSNRPYAATAEMIVSGQVDFVPQDCALRLMREHKDFAIAVAEQLSASYYLLHNAIRSLGLTNHPVERLAKLLLSWTTAEDSARGSYHSFKLPLTHEEIADSIGSGRETVSKLFSELRRKHLLRLKDRVLTITNRMELQRIVHF